MKRNLNQYIKTVKGKYPYKVNTPKGFLVFGVLPLSDKAQRLVLKEIERQMKDTGRMTKSKYRTLLNLKEKYTSNDGFYRLESGMMPGDFDGDNLKMAMVFDDDVVNSSLIFGDAKVISRSYADKLLSRCDVPDREEPNVPCREILKGVFNKPKQPLKTPYMDRILTGYEVQENTCNHRFSNNESAIITIGEGICRCEKCNREFSTDIIMDEDIVDESKVIQDIKNLDLEALFNDEEDL